MINIITVLRGDSMIIKLKQIPFLDQLLKSYFPQKLNITLQYKLAKLHNALIPEVEFYQTQFNKISENFEKDENGNIVNENGLFKIKKENAEKVFPQIEELDNLEISIPDIYFSLDELEPLNLTLEQMTYFEPFIKN